MCKGITYAGKAKTVSVITTTLCPVPATSRFYTILKKLHTSILSLIMSIFPRPMVRDYHCPEMATMTRYQCMLFHLQDTM